MARAVDGKVAEGKVYELGGPEIATLEHLVRYMLKVTMRRRIVADLPWSAARLQARALEIADMVTLGLLPNDLKLTRDQVTLLQTDNVVSERAKAEGRTIEALGLTPTAVEAVVPGYLWTFRKAGQFAVGRGKAAEAAVPDLLTAEPMNPGSQHRPHTASGPAIGADVTRPSRMGSRWGTRR